MLVPVDKDSKIRNPGTHDCILMIISYIRLYLCFRMCPGTQPGHMNCMYKITNVKVQLISIRKAV